MKLSQTSQFKKDIKKQLRKGKNQQKLLEVIELLLSNQSSESIELKFLDLVWVKRDPRDLETSAYVFPLECECEVIPPGEVVKFVYIMSSDEHLWSRSYGNGNQFSVLTAEPSLMVDYDSNSGTFDEVYGLKMEIEPTKQARLLFVPQVPDNDEINRAHFLVEQPYAQNILYNSGSDRPEPGDG